MTINFKLTGAVVSITSVGINDPKLPLGIQITVEHCPEVSYSELHQYPEYASGTRDYDFNMFDQKKAEMFYEKAKKKVNQKSIPKAFRKSEIK